jgi:hypothetical protein
MSRQTVLYILLVLVVLGATPLIDWFHFRTHWQRRCTGRLWKSRFPQASAAEIRRFLELFVAAFAFSRRRKLKFEPTDRVMEIYRTRNPSMLPDSLELETLVKMVKMQYGFDLVAAWHPDMTLGELFSMATKRVA